MNLDDFWLNALWSLAPSIGIGVMFWVVMRAVIRADRSERNAYSRIEAKVRAKRVAEQQNRRDPQAKDAVDG